MPMTRAEAYAQAVEESLASGGDPVTICTTDDSGQDFSTHGVVQRGWPIDSTYYQAVATVAATEGGTA